jgi:hypothetical protein
LTDIWLIDIKSTDIRPPNILLTELVSENFG